MSQSFALVATGAQTSVFQMMRSKNPVHSVFYLVLLFLHCSGLLVLQGLEYFVLLQLLVYVGALAILFLFVVMLLDIPSTEILAHQRGTYPVAGVLGLCLLFASIAALMQPLSESPFQTLPLPTPDNLSSSVDSSYSFWNHSRKKTSTVANLGIALYGVHPDLLILASLQLLVAMVGAVGLTQKRPVSVPNQDVFAQHYVDFQKVVLQIPGEKSTFLKIHALFFFSFFFLMKNSLKKLRGSLWDQPMLVVAQNHLISYPTPSNLNANYNWGVLAGLCLVLQIRTGIFQAMHYTAHVDLAFHSVQHQMRDVPNGWLLRYLHANGASLFFIVVYMHLFRGQYYTSYAQPRELVWLVGVIIQLVMIQTAFIGYVLPWGQMSLWGRTVITSQRSALPLVGTSIVGWLWGGFAVDNPTLNRFYSFHYLFPFLLAALSLVHLAALHQYGSTNPLGIHGRVDQIDFYPYFYTKDLVARLRMSRGAAYLVSFNPELLGHPDNNIPANPYSTPAHIVPEWYFQAVYRILRSIPDKLLGVCGVGLFFVVLRSLPWIHKPRVKSPMFNLVHQKLVWRQIADCFLLSYLGSCPAEDPYIGLGQQRTTFFFIVTLSMRALPKFLEFLYRKGRRISKIIFFFYFIRKSGVYKKRKNFQMEKIFFKIAQNRFFQLEHSIIVLKNY